MFTSPPSTRLPPRDPLSPTNPTPWASSGGPTSPSASGAVLWGGNRSPESPNTPLGPSSSVPSMPSSSSGLGGGFGGGGAAAGAGGGGSGGMRTPQVHGAPGMGLTSPPPSASTSGGADSGDAQGPFLRVRIGPLERNRKDLLIRFDASTNLPNFRTSLYKNMQRSYVEFQRFAEQAQLTSPQTIMPALPLASTSAMTDEEDDRLVRVALQRWFSRVCEDAVLQKDDELRSFIESDFGYSPIPPPSARRAVSATSAVPSVLSAAISKVVRRGPMDEDDDLQMAKGALERLEERWGGAAAAVGTLGKTRRAHAVAYQDMGSKMISLSTVESDHYLGLAERKIGRSLEQLSGMHGAQASSENVVLSDSLGYQALNARAAKDALLQRTQLLEDSQTASKAAITKRRNVERLKGSSNINPAKVDEALLDMAEANALEDSLNFRLKAISANLHIALRHHSRQTHEDVAVALLENARLSLGYHRHLLRELESLRPDLARVGTAPAERQSTMSTASAPPPPQSGPLGMPASQSQPSMLPSRPYQPPQAGMDTSKSMFLPPSQARAGDPRPSSTGPGARGQGGVDGLPAGNAGQGAYAGQGQRQAQTPGQVQGQQGQQGMRPDPLSGQMAGQMAQSMVLPGAHGAARPGAPRNQGRKLDERQAAKLLSGGF